jgi:hypothetical protein
LGAPVGGLVRRPGFFMEMCLVSKFCNSRSGIAQMACPAVKRISDVFFNAKEENKLLWLRNEEYHFVPAELTDQK